MGRKKRYQRKRNRVKIKGTAERPRISVFRSHKHIYAQLVDDQKRRTLVAASDQELKKVKKQKPKTQIKEGGMTRKVAIAYEVGKLVAEKALAKKIKKAVFDRGRYKYHGRVKAVAEGAREGGLEF